MKLIIFILSCSTFHLCSAKFPVAHIEPCALTDSKCISDVITYILKNHRTGLPELGLFSIDPLKIEKADIQQGGDRPVNIQLNFRNGQLYGLSQAKLRSITGFSQILENVKIEIKGTVPALTYISDYKASGRVLILPVQGNGKSNITFEKVDAVIKFIPKLITKNGKEYIQVDKLKIRLVPSRLLMNFEGIFSGSPLIEETTNQFLNENWKDIYNEVAPTIENEISAIVKQLSNKVFAKTPYNDLFKFN